jgi:hypothetical protein
MDACIMRLRSDESLSDGYVQGVVAQRTLGERD